MKILIATTVNPFVEGGSTYIVDWLDHALRDRGHEVETYRFPFSDHPDHVLDQLMGFRLIDLSQHGDRLITIRTPSHLLKHPNKVVWFIHHYRSAYDLWGTKYQTLPSTPEGDATRQAIIAADNVGLRESSLLFCNSKVVQQRVKRFNSLDAEVLYPPLLRPEHFRCDAYGDYLLYFSRLTHHKRQWLAVESLRYTKTPVKLMIAGAPDPGCEPYVAQLESLVRRYKLGDRVTILPWWIDDDQKIKLFAGCLAGLYFPLDEDSYGYPSLEAHAAHKAVITTTDSGGTEELIVNGENGFLTPPDPQLIAEAMDFLYSNRQAARKMGESGPARMKEIGIGWDHVVRRLLS